MSWSIEKAALVGEIYDRRMAVHFSTYESLSELASDWPDGHYVWVTHQRLEPLVNAFERLWLISRMLKVDGLPLYGRDGAFVSRAEWLRLTHELLLVRLAAIRDLVALLVAAVYELEIPQHTVTIPRVMKEAQVSANAPLCASIRRLAEIAPALRAERNQLIHTGVRRAFGEYQLFDTVAHVEAIGGRLAVEPLRQEDGTVKHFDLAKEYSRIAHELEDELGTTASALQHAVLEELDLLLPEWRGRFQAKAKRRG